MRVLLITENYPPSAGGMAQSCDRIVRGLRAAGLTLDVAHLTRRARPSSVTREVGGELLTCPLAGDPEHAMRRLWTVVDGRDYSHVMAFGATLPMLGAPVLAAWLDAPLVTLLRGNDFDTAVFSPRRQGPLLSALRASAAVCVVAHPHKRLVRALVPDAVVRWVANGIDTSTWEVLPSEQVKADALRAGVGDRRVIGLVGQLKRKKGVGFLLDALLASGHAASLHLLLVGELEDEVLAQLAGQDVLTYSREPFLDRYQLPARYAACDVVALPSFYDGLPNVALEAAALGVPLLASDAGGLADLVDDEIGFPFRAGDPLGCRRAVDRAAAASEAELVKLGAAAAERVRRDFTVGAETQGYLEVLREVRS